MRQRYCHVLNCSLIVIHKFGNLTKTDENIWSPNNPNTLGHTGLKLALSSSTQGEGEGDNVTW